LKSLAVKREDRGKEEWLGFCYLKSENIEVGRGGSAAKFSRECLTDFIEGLKMIRKMPSTLSHSRTSVVSSLCRGISLKQLTYLQYKHICHPVAVPNLACVV
jgi:hypothetical protein